MASSKRFRYVMLIWVYLEILCFGGIHYGWGALIYILKNEGIHEELCVVNSNTDNSSVVISNVNASSKDPGCPEQDLRFNLYYSIATSAFVVFTLAGGQIFSRLGSRFIRCLFMCFFWAGCLMLLFADKDVPWLVCPGLMFVAGGGFVCILTSAQVANYFTSGSSVVLGIMNGVQDSSSVIQLFVKLAYDSGIKRTYSYTLILCLSTMVIVSTFVFFPKTFISKSSEIAIEVKANDIKTVSGDAVKEIPYIPPVEEDNDVRKHIFNPIFIMHAIWFSLLFFRFNYFIGTVNHLISGITDNREQVSHFTNVLSYTMFCGIFSSFAGGLMYNWQKEKYKKAVLEVDRKIRPAFIPSLIETCLLAALSALVFVPYTEVLYVMFIVFTIFRSFLFCVGLSFIAEAFPTEAFGVLYTVMITVGSVLSFLQFAFFHWSESYEGAAVHVNILMMVLSVVAFVHPIYLWLKCRQGHRKDQSHQTVLRNTSL